jgi:hypothetical protein
MPRKCKFELVATGLSISRDMRGSLYGHVGSLNQSLPLLRSLEPPRQPSVLVIGHSANPDIAG